VPSEILIHASIEHRGFSLLHEIGHLLDFAALGRFRDFGSARAEAELAQWHEAIEASSDVQRLRAAITEFVSVLPVDAIEMRRRLERALAPEELWARSYAQYVSLRSGDPDLLSSLEALRTERLGTVYYPMHWEDGDFRLIGEAIETLFRGLGWRTEPEI
jgi:hypothetical protein